MKLQIKEFIKKLFKSKNNEEVKKEYKKVQEPNEIEPKANYTAIAEDYKANISYRSHVIVDNILKICFTAIRPEQEDCPYLIIHNFKQLYELGDCDSIGKAVNLSRIFLNESQREDLINKVSQCKEYKEYIMKNRIKELEEDFKDGN